jgi:hypothetical protein
MSNKKEEFLKLIVNSSISEEAKKTWQDMLDFIDDETVTEFINTIKQDPSALEIFTENLKQKIESMKNKNGWNKILKEEKDFLKQ